jgi:hypothetical protein
MSNPEKEPPKRGMRTSEDQEFDGRQWVRYEELSRYLLNRLLAKELGLRVVEGKQKIPGKSGTVWEIDGKGILEGGEGFVILECRRRTTSRINQEQVAALAFRLSDTDAEGGILVSPLGFQEGASKVGASQNIISVEIHPNSTETDFVVRALDKLLLGIHIRGKGTLTGELGLLKACTECGKQFSPSGSETICSDCASK